MRGHSNKLLRADSHAMEINAEMMWMDTIIVQSDAFLGSSSSLRR